MIKSSGHPLTRLFSHHPRQWGDSRYVYPVISRRSGGLSLGINLSPRGLCNFDCVYCCVQRSGPVAAEPIDLDLLRRELDDLLGSALDGSIWRDEPFSDTPASLRRLSDLAISGDGEPTLCPQLEDVIRLVGQLKAARCPDISLVLFTNASLLDQQRVEQALTELDRWGGRVWVKLDAGDWALYQRVNRSVLPLERILTNILHCGRRRPIVVQTMLLEWAGRAITDLEFDAYIDRLIALVVAGCQVQLVQLYTVARQPAESGAAPVDEARLQELAQRLRRRLPALDVAVFGPPEALTPSI